MATKQSDLNNNNNDDDNSDNSLDTLPADDSESELSSSPPRNKSSLKINMWGVLEICHEPHEISLIKNEYTAGRLEHVDIQFNEENTELKRLLQTSKTQFIIKRERVTNYGTADNEGDFVVFIYDKSMNGTFINKRKLKDKKGILHHNDTISIIEPEYEVFTYKQSTHPVDIPPRLAENYVALRTLGEGVCGPVTLIYSKTDYCPLALKYIRKKGLDETAYRDIFMNEVDILKELKHPNVIKMVHAINESPDFFIMLEFMQGGELLGRITKNGGLSEKITKFYFYQVATAVEYLHGKGITHRDLKPENILLLDNDEYTLVKVTDFGVSKMINHETIMNLFCGTYYYIAPEIFEKLQYTSQVDVWSLGVILYRMLSNRLPFTERGNKDLPDIVMEGTYNYLPNNFKNVSENVKSLINNMLTVNPKDRYTAPKILAHLWFDDTEVMGKISNILEPHINVNNNDNSENKRPNVDREIGSPQRDDKFLNNTPMKLQRLG